MRLGRKINIDNIFCEYANDEIVISQNENSWTYKILDGRLCRMCNHPLKKNNSSDICRYCSDNDFYFKQIYALGSYYKKSKGISIDNLSDHILELKEKEIYSYPLGMALALFVNFCHPNLMEADVIVPVPKFSGNNETKKYNHSESLANIFNKFIPIPINNCLIKTNNEKMVGKNREQRFNAAEHMYECHERIIGDVILIDDILTTSATANICAYKLLENGANKVDVLVLGRTIIN